VSKAELQLQNSLQSNRLFSNQSKMNAKLWPFFSNYGEEWKTIFHRTSTNAK